MPGQGQSDRRTGPERASSARAGPVPRSAPYAQRSGIGPQRALEAITKIPSAQRESPSSPEPPQRAKDRSRGASTRQLRQPESISGSLPPIPTRARTSKRLPHGHAGPSCGALDDEARVAGRSSEAGKPRRRFRLKFDRKLENHKNGSVKTTLDLPPDLVREIKLMAVNEGRKLKDVISDLLRKGLGHSASQFTDKNQIQGRRGLIPLPFFAASSAAPAKSMTLTQLQALEEQALSSADIESFHPTP